MNRYSRNMKMLTREENDNLKNSKVCVVGCGGLGGYIIEMLGRLGIGYITAIDGDIFDTTNLNRQLLANDKTLGENKALGAKKRMELVNSLIKIEPIQERLTLENAENLLKGHDVVVDAVDNIDTRFILQDICEKLEIPLVYGAIAGWYGQVSTIFPGDKMLNKIYPKSSRKGIENELGNPSFTPALVASIQVSEVLKILIGRGEILRNKLLLINTLEQEYEEIEL